MDALAAAQITNAAACLIMLWASWALFRRLMIHRGAGLPLLLALSIFLTYALYKQLFCDLLQVGLLLIYINLITTPGFLRKPFMWTMCGMVMALATYAKVYSFYFLLLHFPLSIYCLRKSGSGGAFPVKAWALSFLTQAALLVPLIMLMHRKYGFLSLSASGALNTSWTLSGHKSPKPGIGSLIPPPYPNAPYTWEDPYLTEGALHTRFESLAMMKSQIGHSIKAGLQAVEAAGQISPFLLAVLLASAAAMIWKKGPHLSGPHKILLLASAVMPLGYLLLHVEARYLWLLLIAGMALGAMWLEWMRRKSGIERLYRAASIVFAASFIIWPVYDMKTLFRSGQDVRGEAAQLKAMGLTGSFTSNDNPSRSGLLAYWMDGSFYTPVSETLSAKAVLADMRRYRVKYYLAYRKDFDITEPFLPDETGRPLPEVSGGRTPGMRIFLVNP
jgi:hypothetical protein